VAFDRLEKNFQDWTHHVLEELVKLNSKYESLREDYHQLTEQMDKIDKILSGGASPEHGLIVRFDRLEQESVRKSAWTKAAIGASVTAMFGFIGMLVKLVYK
jgi:hypothetical protein